MSETDIAENLPELEREAFQALRANGSATVNEVLDRLAARGRLLKYTTVMTVLTRLWQKGYLERQPEGRAFRYRVRSQEEIACELGGRAVHQAIERFGAPALMGFVHSLSDEQRRLVEQLLHDHAGDELAEEVT